MVKKSLPGKATRSNIIMRKSGGPMVNRHGGNYVKCIIGVSALTLLGLALLFMIGVFITGLTMYRVEENSLSDRTLEIYHSPACECCERYEEYLESSGVSLSLLK